MEGFLIGIGAILCLYGLIGYLGAVFVEHEAQGIRNMLLGIVLIAIAYFFTIFSTSSSFFWIGIAMGILGAFAYKNRHRIRAWWRVFGKIPEDEFHDSMNQHAPGMVQMQPWERKLYIKRLVDRREIAHERDVGGKF